MLGVADSRAAGWRDMIRYSDNLYLTEYTKKKLSEIRIRLFTGAGMAGIWFILLSENGEDVFDIVPAFMFKQKYYRKLDHTIIGIAESSEAAFDLVQDIVEEHFRVTGTYMELRRDIEERVLG